MRILFDTNACIRHSGGRLPKRIVSLIEKPSTEVLVSIVTPWEIVLKPSLSKTGLDAREIRQTIDDLSARLIPITLDHIDQFENLPKYHDDPFDRMIIAQALTENCPVVSSDQRFPLYAKQGLKVLWER